jgi:hypothetical protein
MLKEVTKKWLRKFDSRRNFLCDWIPAKGKSGRILFGLSVDRFDVRKRIQVDYILVHSLWDKELEFK